jgi:hypothetical protein
MFSFGTPNAPFTSLDVEIGVLNVKFFPSDVEIGDCDVWMSADYVGFGANEPGIFPNDIGSETEGTRATSSAPAFARA